MAETVHLVLKANGTVIKGDSSQKSLDRADTIECIYYEESVTTARDAATGLATGRRQHQPLIIRKRIDRSSPLLAKALVNNEVIEGDFKFYRPHTKGDGTTEQFYTVTIKQGRVSSLKQWVPDTTDADATHHQPMEEIGFVFHTISWTITNGGVTHEDTWSGNT